MENFRIFDFEVDSHVEKNLAVTAARAIDKHGRGLTPPFTITPGSTGGFCCFEDSAGVFGDVSKDGRLTVRWTKTLDDARVALGNESRSN